MARKIDVKLILELRAAKMSRNMIAETRHMSRYSVSDVFAIADRKNIEYNDVKNLDDNAVYTTTWVETGKTNMRRYCSKRE